jgi:hypothetical protein
MAFIVDNSYVLELFSLLICILLHVEIYIPLLDVTLIIKYMLWNMYVMLAERQVVVHCKNPFIFLKD